MGADACVCVHLTVLALCAGSLQVRRGRLLGGFHPPVQPVAPRGGECNGRLAPSSFRVCPCVGVFAYRWCRRHRQWWVPSTAQVHKGVQAHKCQVSGCVARYRHRDSLLVHMRADHPNKPYPEPAGTQPLPQPPPQAATAAATTAATAATAAARQVVSGTRKRRRTAAAERSGGRS